MLPQPGSTFGRYQMRDKLGRGGMGVVFAAVHTDLDREVAIKLLSPEFADDDGYRNRFLREAKTLAKLSSPHITTVYDAGEQDGWLFIATELISGGDLKMRLASRGTLAIDEAAGLVAQMAEGLQVAHEHGILHRDIKPSNVLLRPNRAGGEDAVLCDLGIAATLGSDYTKTSGVIGTLGYMAPERHEGREATVASDIYALGCVMWACLTGEPPYSGTDMQVAMGHVTGEIPTLQGQSTSQLVALNAFLQKSMAKRPEDRYATAAEVVAALELLGRPLAAVSGPAGRAAGEPEIESADLSSTVRRSQFAVVDYDPAPTQVDAQTELKPRDAPVPSSFASQTRVAVLGTDEVPSIADANDVAGSGREIPQLISEERRTLGSMWLLRATVGYEVAAIATIGTYRSWAQPSALWVTIVLAVLGALLPLVLVRRSRAVGRLVGLAALVAAPLLAGWFCWGSPWFSVARWWDGLPLAMVALGAQLASRRRSIIGPAAAVVVLVPLARAVTFASFATSDGRQSEPLGRRDYSQTLGWEIWAIVLSVGVLLSCLALAWAFDRAIRFGGRGRFAVGISVAALLASVLAVVLPAARFSMQRGGVIGVDAANSSVTDAGRVMVAWFEARSCADAERLAAGYEAQVLRADCSRIYFTDVRGARVLEIDRFGPNDADVVVQVVVLNPVTKPPHVYWTTAHVTLQRGAWKFTGWKD